MNAPKDDKRSTCSSGKSQYISREQANHARRHLPARLRVYRCPECRHWHLANPEKR